MSIEFDPADDVPDSDDAEAIFKAKSKPFCKVHFCKMESMRSFPTHTQYNCIVPGCKIKVAKMRPEYEIPSEPQSCPRCSKRSKEVFCVVREMRTFNVRLECPNERCRFYIDVPRPDIDRQIKNWDRKRS